MTPGRFRKRSSIPQKHPPARIAFSTVSLTYRPPYSSGSAPACQQSSLALEHLLASHGQAGDGEAGPRDPCREVALRPVLVRVILGHDDHLRRREAIQRLRGGERRILGSDAALGADAVLLEPGEDVLQAGLGDLGLAVGV